jgi:hypothetical protein
MSPLTRLLLGLVSPFDEALVRTLFVRWVPRIDEM